MADTYDRRIQLDASRLRYKDALALQRSERWNGAIYLGGYAIECSLKSLICYESCIMNLKDTRMFKSGMQGTILHNLGRLREESRLLELAIKLDKTGKLSNAWSIIIQLWQKDGLRYGRNLGHKAECDRFLQAVESLYSVILRKQGEDFE